MLVRRQRVGCCLATHIGKERNTGVIWIHYCKAEFGVKIKRSSVLFHSCLSCHSDISYCTSNVYTFNCLKFSSNLPFLALLKICSNFGFLSFFCACLVCYAPYSFITANSLLTSRVRSSVWEWFIGGFCKRRVCFRLMVCFGFLQAPLCPLRVVENVIVLVFYSKNDLASISKMVYFSSPQIWFSFDTSNRDVTLSYRYGPRIRLTETSGVTTRGKKGGGKQFWSCSFVFVLPSQISLFCWSILHLTCS